MCPTMHRSQSVYVSLESPKATGVPAAILGRVSPVFVSSGQLMPEHTKGVPQTQLLPPGGTNPCFVHTSTSMFAKWKEVGKFQPRSVQPDFSPVSGQKCAFQTLKISQLFLRKQFTTP